MQERLPRDPLALDPDGAAWQQLHTFAVEPRTFLERLAASPLFGGVLRDDWGTVEWIRHDAEDECCSFPLGRVTVHPGGILLESFSEERLADLRRHAADLGAGPLTADETRAFRLEHVLAHPDALLTPLRPAGAMPRSSREIAELWLRMAWPFFPRQDLGGRAPHAAAHTERGRAALVAILDRLRDELETIPGFPRFTSRALRSILLPSQAPRPVLSAKRPAPTRSPRGD